MIHALTVTRNEAGRYLQRMLASVAGAVDNHFVYDDQSTDDTATICVHAGCHVTKRPAWVPAFVEHEGKFRHDAWIAFEHIVQPVAGDWVLAIDADELLVGERGDLDDLISKAEAAHAWGVTLAIPEVWADEPIPQVRVDGWWGRLTAARLFPYRQGGGFAMSPMACGSVPTYVLSRPAYLGNLSSDDDAVSLLHYGYAREEDRKVKHARYSTRGGHQRSHVASILAPPVLRPWKGPLPRARL